jgi:xylan 1,4-beta-xylosidase
MHDSYHQAAYVLEKIKQVGNAPTSMSYWVFTDIFEEAGPRFTPFHGGFGLLNYQGIKKPAFHAFAFLNQLGQTELRNADRSSWACKNANGDIQVLFWDFTNTHPGDSVNNQVYYVRDLPAHPKGKVTVDLTGVPAGTYELEISQIGYKVNDPYTAYLSMGRPAQVTKQQVQLLKNASEGTPLVRETASIASSGHWSKEFAIRENDVFLVRLIKH